ncbi:MAG: PqqD family peptide modification chaperone [Romboutsia sp.]|uniref:PqqD family peptide modification chaperone n=1 Tax=Romboutsia sp. TaxID=1965302 RepID=UPI003F3D3B71
MTNEEILNIVFKLSNEVNYEVDNNIVTIIHNQNHWIQNFFRKLRFTIPMEKKITLDKYSSFVFLQIDGNKTVKDIGYNLELNYGDKSHPLYERLLLFLNHIEVNCNYIEKLNS